MIKIITDNKTYIWNYKQLLKNLAITICSLLLLVAYLIASTSDFYNLE